MTQRDILKSAGVLVISPQKAAGILRRDVGQPVGILSSFAGCSSILLRSGAELRQEIDYKTGDRYHYFKSYGNFDYAPYFSRQELAQPW